MLSWERSGMSCVGILSKTDRVLQGLHTTLCVYQIHYVGMTISTTSWCHQMETYHALPALCVGNLPVIAGSTWQRPVTRRFDAFIDVCLNKRLSKQSGCRWFEAPWRSLWRHCNGKDVIIMWRVRFAVIRCFDVYQRKIWINQRLSRWIFLPGQRLYLSAQSWNIQFVSCKMNINLDLRFIIANVYIYLVSGTMSYVVIKHDFQHI